MRRALTLVLLVVLLAIGLFLGGRNAQPVTLDYYFGAFELSLAVALILSLLAGIILGSLAVYLGTVVRLQSRNRRLRRELSSHAEPGADRLLADE